MRRAPPVPRDVSRLRRDEGMNIMPRRLVAMVNFSVLLCGLSTWILASASAHAAIARLEGEARTLPALPGMMSLSGGIGEFECDAVQRRGPAYNLGLVFALQEGNDRLDVPVVITDEQDNKVLDMVLVGPLLYIKLPPGRYTVTAQVNGHTQQRVVQVGQWQPPLYLHW